MNQQLNAMQTLQFTHSFNHRAIVASNVHLPSMDRRSIQVIWSLGVRYSHSTHSSYVWHRHVFICDCIARCCLLLVYHRSVVPTGLNTIANVWAFGPFNLAANDYVYTYLLESHVLRNIHQVLNSCGFRFFVLIRFLSYVCVCLFKCVIDWLFSHMLHPISKRRHYDHRQSIRSC